MRVACPPLVVKKIVPLIPRGLWIEFFVKQRGLICLPAAVRVREPKTGKRVCARMAEHCNKEIAHNIAALQSALLGVFVVIHGKLGNRELLLIFVCITVIESQHIRYAGFCFYITVILYCQHVIVGVHTLKIVKYFPVSYVAKIIVAQCKVCTLRKYLAAPIKDFLHIFGLAEFVKGYAVYHFVCNVPFVNLRLGRGNLVYMFLDIFFKGCPVHVLDLIITVKAVRTYIAALQNRHPYRMAAEILYSLRLCVVQYPT